MAVAKVILNGTTLIDTTDKTVSSSNLLQSYTALGADGNTVTGSFGLDNITINTENLPSQNTTIEDGFIGTQIWREKEYNINNSTYLELQATNSTYVKLFYFSSLKNTYYKIIGEINLKWANNDTETYNINIDNQYHAINSVVSAPFTWSGSGRSQTFTSITLNFNSGGYVTTRLLRDNVITDSVTILDSSYLSLWINEYDGYESVTLNLIDNPQYLSIYKSLAKNISINTSNYYVNKYFNELSQINQYEFAGKKIGGNIVFNNLSSMDAFAFAFPWNGNGQSTTMALTVDFLDSRLSIISNYVFSNNGCIRQINAPYISSIGSYAFYSCRYLSNISFPECISISQQAFYSCASLIEVSFPKCTYIGISAFQSCDYLTTVSFPECIYIGASAFNNNKKLTNIYFPKCISINYWAFQSCPSLTTVSFPECTQISGGAFSSCFSLTSVSFSKCTQISGGAFYNCSNLSDIYFPICETIGISAFYNCSNLIQASFPSCTYIYNNAFSNCVNLAIISFPNCSYISFSAFYNCSNLTTVSFPECTVISSNVFNNCINLSSIYFPKCTYLGAYAFYNCSNLTTVSFPECTGISNYVFYSCRKLESIYFMGSSIISLSGTTAFNGTPILYSSYLGYYGSIYVPASLLASYKTATNWATYSSRMVGI